MQKVGSYSWSWGMTTKMTTATKTTMADDNDNVPEHDNKDDNGNEGNDPNDRAHQPEGDASLALLADAVLITYRPSRIILGRA